MWRSGKTSTGVFERETPPRIATMSASTTAAGGFLRGVRTTVDLSSARPGGLERLADRTEEPVLGAVQVDDRLDLGGLGGREGALGVEDLELDALSLLVAELR